MIKAHLLLESEKKIRFIDAKKYEERRLFDICSRVHINSPLLLKEQQLVLHNYFEFLLASRRLRPRSIYTYMHHLSGMAKTLHKPFSNVTKEDLIKYFAGLREESSNTIVSRQCILRKFFTWLGKKDVIDWIKFAKLKKRDLTPDCLITPDEIKRMVSVCKKARDRCLLMMTYEGALRRGEVSGIKIKDIVENEHGMTVRVDGKTGVRSLLLIDSVPYIKAWLNEHQYRQEQEAPLFYSFANNEYGRPLEDKRLAYLVKHTAKRAEISKKVFPHLLRHSRLDYLGRQGFRERDLKIFAGWTEDSKMANTYLHYGIEEVEKKLLALKGIQREHEPSLDTTFKPLICQSCNKENTPTTMYCDCGELLAQDKRAKADAIMNKLFEHEEFKALVKKLLKEDKV